MPHALVMQIPLEPDPLTNPAQESSLRAAYERMAAAGGIEPPTQGGSGHQPTNSAPTDGGSIAI